MCWEGAGGDREDVNNALQGMVVRSQGCREYKGVCVCHKNEEVLLQLKANLTGSQELRMTPTSSTAHSRDKVCVCS